METKKLSLFLVLFCLSNISYSQVSIDKSPYKIALSFDGNAHDADDLIAAPLALALIAEAGLKDRVVHVDYSNHIWHDHGNSNDVIGDQVVGMRNAVNGAVSKWNYTNDVFYEVRISSELIAAKKNFKAKVAAAHNAGERLYYVLGGPMEVSYQCVEQVPPHQRSSITAVSHSTWNETHQHGSSRTWDQLKNTGIKTVQIADQNTYDCHMCGDDDDMSTKQFSKWKWLESMGGKYKWLYNQNPFPDKFDPSDAGMTWWVITGRPGIGGESNPKNLGNNTNNSLYASPTKIEELFKKGMVGGGGTLPAPRYFFIVNKKTGKKIRPENDSDNARIMQAPAEWSEAYVQWEQIPTDNGYFYLKNRATGKYFRPDTKKDFVDIIQKPTSYDGLWTQWKIVDIGDGYFHLENRATSRRIRSQSYDDMNSGNDPSIELAPIDWTGDWVRWKFVEAGSGARLLAKTNTPTKKADPLIEAEESLDEAYEINIYPNPTSAYLNVAGVAKDAQLQVFDMMGNELINITGQNNINVSMFPTGMYLLTIDGKYKQRFLKN